MKNTKEFEQTVADGNSLHVGRVKVQVVRKNSKSTRLKVSVNGRDYQKELLRIRLMNLEFELKAQSDKLGSEIKALREIISSLAHENLELGRDNTMFLRTLEGNHELLNAFVAAVKKDGGSDGDDV